MQRFQEKPIGSRLHGVSAHLQVFDWPEQQVWADEQSEDGWTSVKGWSQPNSPPTGLRETDLEPVEYDLDLSREVEPRDWEDGAPPLGGAAE